jgi:PhnB protein
MSFSCHLTFDGRCAEAFRTYQRVLGGDLKLLEYGESPMANQVPPHWQRKIVHATFVLDARELLGSDAFPDAYEPPRGFAVTLAIPDPARAKRIFESLADNGRVNVPFQETFWSPGYGFVVDRFGVPWEVNSGGPASEKHDMS